MPIRVARISFSLTVCSPLFSRFTLIWKSSRPASKTSFSFPEVTSRAGTMPSFPPMNPVFSCGSLSFFLQPARMSKESKSPRIR